MSEFAMDEKNELYTTKLKLSVLQTAIQQKILSENSPLVGFIDVDGIKRTVKRLTDSFPENFSHMFAVKANGMQAVLSTLRECGMGAEVASPGELAQALKAGFDKKNINFDEPAKSAAIILSALESGVNLNIDNFQEFEIVREYMEMIQTSSTVGFRVNPQIGAGSIGAMSTATIHSKFGVPLADEGVRDKLIELYCNHSWLTSLHTHVGSQGCTLELMTQGVGIATELVEQINALIGHQQITKINIGGGLSVNFNGEEVRPDFSEYASLLRDRIPVLFADKYTVLTEFGRSIMAKNGFMVSHVEYSKVSGGRPIAITHCGAQVAARTVFMPDAWPLRVTAHGPTGELKQTPIAPQDIAGPCCFAGDKLATINDLPLLDRGDYAMIHDTGAYYFSSPLYYNSLPAPPVYVFYKRENNMTFDMIRPAQTLEQMMAVIG